MLDFYSCDLAHLNPVASTKNCDSTQRDYMEILAYFLPHYCW